LEKLGIGRYLHLLLLLLPRGCVVVSAADGVVVAVAVAGVSAVVAVVVVVDVPQYHHNP